MSLSPRFNVRAAAIATIVFAALCASMTFAATRDELSPWPHDLSPSGLRAALAIGGDPALLGPLLPEGAAEAVHAFVAETRAMGLAQRSNVLYLVCTRNVMA